MLSLDCDLLQSELLSKHDPTVHRHLADWPQLPISQHALRRARTMLSLEPRKNIAKSIQERRKLHKVRMHVCASMIVVLQSCEDDRSLRAHSLTRALRSHSLSTLHSHAYAQ
jgi:hypothetical protein